MSRLVKKSAILAKVETTSGVDAAPTGAANAIQVMDQISFSLESEDIDLNLLLPWLGNSPSLAGSSSLKLSFAVPLGGSGAAATAPAWGSLLLACANAETTGLTVPNRVEYLTATDTLKTNTIYYYDDGALHKLLGAYGNVKLEAKSGGVPKLMFDFVGVDGGIVAATNPTAVLSAWKVPPSITKANVTDIVLGATYATGALTGGTSYNSSGLTLDWGNKVEFAPLLSTEEVVLNDRKSIGTVSLELSAAQEVTMMAAVKANTLQSLGFVIGNTTGNKMMLFFPSVQLKSPKKEEFRGKRMIGFDMKVNPLAGNDEIRLVLL